MSLTHHAGAARMKRDDNFQTSNEIMPAAIEGRPCYGIGAHGVGQASCCCRAWRHMPKSWRGGDSLFWYVIRGAVKCMSKENRPLKINHATQLFSVGGGDEKWSHGGGAKMAALERHLESGGALTRKWHLSLQKSGNRSTHEPYLAGKVRKGE